MTREQQLSVLRAYEEQFKNWEPERADPDRKLPVGMSMGIKHARWMIQEMIGRLEANKETGEGQAERWIGFIQALLWVNGFYSIDEMRKANVTSVDS